ncbi:MAG: hypothetical protein J5644_07020 [Bacteroidales bacterium]|nr:hypothetical protein [Bacteroidales bacterium]
MLQKTLLFLVLTLPLLLRAQSDPPIRIELETAKDQNDYLFANAGEQGVYVFFESRMPSADSTAWAFVCYDTNLQKKFHFVIPMPAHTQYIAHARSDQYLYFLFQKNLPKKEPTATYLLTVDLTAPRYHLRPLPEFTHRQPVGLHAADGHLLIHATDSRRDSIFFLNPSNGSLFCIRDLFPYRAEFCTADTSHHRWLIGLRTNKNEKEEELFLYEYNYLTGASQIYNFPSTPNLTYNSARAFLVNADTLLIAGTYNSLQNRYSSNLHSGVYTMLYHNHQIDSAKIFNYSNLKGKETENATLPNDLNLQLIVGPTAHNDLQYTFITEVYYPEYDYNYNYYDPYYSAGPTTSSTFAGYHFTHAYITTFNRSGDLVWDHYFPFNSLISMQLRNFLQVSYLDQDAIIYYPRNNRIHSTLVNQYDVLERISSINIETTNSREVVEYNRGTEVMPWYRNYYLVAGYQNLKNKDKKIRPTRYVFFINKLEYR